jgi:hypothetical protein
MDRERERERLGFGTFDLSEGEREKRRVCAREKPSGRSLVLRVSVEQLELTVENAVGCRLDLLSATLSSANGISSTGSGIYQHFNFRTCFVILRNNFLTILPIF